MCYKHLQIAANSHDGHAKIAGICSAVADQSNFFGHGFHTSSDVEGSESSSLEASDFRSPAAALGWSDRRKIASTRSIDTTKSLLSCSNSTGIASRGSKRTLS